MGVLRVKVDGEWIDVVGAGEQGEPGPQGTPGATGPQGPKGTTGATGPAGADSTVPGPQGPQGVQGPTGPVGGPGTPGEVWHLGTVAPSPALGNPGDLYLNTVNGNYSEKNEDNNAWIAKGTLKGPKGDTGTTGATGPTGPAGADSTVPGPVGPTGPTGPTGADSTVPGPPAAPSVDAGNDIVRGSDQQMFFDHEGNSHRHHRPFFNNTAERNAAIPNPHDQQECVVAGNPNVYCAVVGWFRDPVVTHQSCSTGGTVGPGAWGTSYTITIGNAPRGYYLAFINGVMDLPNAANFYANLVLGPAQTGDYQWGHEPYLSVTCLPFAMMNAVNHPGGNLGCYLRFGFGMGNTRLTEASRITIQRVGQAHDVGQPLRSGPYDPGMNVVPVSVHPTQSSLPDYPIDIHGNPLPPPEPPYSEAE